MNRSASARHWLWLPALLFCSLPPPATAQTGEFGAFAAQELLRQQERERALRERQETSHDVRRPPSAPEQERLPAAKTPCFVIREIALQSTESQFAWALAAADPADDPATGRCLGTAGINLVMRRIQNAIIERGYVTTRVLAGAQDLQTGVLTLTVIPRRVRVIRFSPASDLVITWKQAFPLRLTLSAEDDGLKATESIKAASPFRPIIRWAQ